MSARVKTLAQIFEQYDKVSEYLTAQNRYAAACKVDEIYNGMFERILRLIGIVGIDDEAAELAFNEPVLTSEYSCIRSGKQ